MWSSPIMWLCNFLSDFSHTLIVLHAMFRMRMGVVLGLTPVVYPSSNLPGCLRCSHGWRNSDWRNQLQYFLVPTAHFTRVLQRNTWPARMHNLPSPDSPRNVMTLWLLSARMDKHHHIRKHSTDSGQTLLGRLACFFYTIVAVGQHDTLILEYTTLRITMTWIPLLFRTTSLWLFPWFERKNVGGFYLRNIHYHSPRKIHN